MAPTARSDRRRLDARPSLLRLALAVALAAHVVAALAPGMWVWGLAGARFSPRGLEWWAALAVAAALVASERPALGSAAGALGDALTGPRLWPRLALAAGFAFLVLLLPDRAFFTGDFLLRQGAAITGRTPESLFPQAAPLDRAIHFGVPNALSHWIHPNAYQRLLGALEAGLLAWLGTALARAAGWRGAAALAGVATAVCGGALALFTGYGKAFREMTLMVMATAAAGVWTIRHHRGPALAGVLAGSALLFHRSALALLAPLAVVVAAEIRRSGAWNTSRTIGVAVAITAPAAALAFSWPGLVAAWERTDRIHFGSASWAPTPEAGLPHPWLLRVLDLGNLLLLLVPLAWWLALEWPGYWRARRPERGALTALAAAFSALAIAMRPQQGTFRDWDVAAAAAVAVAVLVSATVAETFSSGRARSGLAWALALSTLGPALGFVAGFSDREASTRRVMAHVAGPPVRPAAERARTWEYLAQTWEADQRWSEAADGYARAAETAPQPAVLRGLARAAAMAGHHRQAREACYRLLSLDPDDVVAWTGIAATSITLGENAEAARAARELLRRDPGSATAREVLARTVDTTRGDPPGARP